MEEDPENRQKTGLVLRKKEAPSNAFKPGQCGNPGGRPRLPSELKELKEASLAKAIKLLHDMVHDDEYLSKLTARDLVSILELAFDRFGLPKVVKAEMEVSNLADIVREARARVNS